jgi:spore coat polysaccharide biosynthesis protein SpsF
MQVGVIIQARMGSKRCPGKVLRPILGKPLIQYLLESLTHCQRIADIAVATTCEPSDDAIAQFCRKLDVDCHRGSTNHVASRFAHVLHKKSWDGFVRLSADSPLLDHRLVDQAVDLFAQSGCDIVTNVFPRTYPHGQSVELVRADAFARGLAEMTSAADQEHVTPIFYRRCASYSIVNFRASQQLNHVRLVVDTHADLLHITSIVSLLNRAHWHYDAYELATFSEAISRPADRLSA